MEDRTETRLETWRTEQKQTTHTGNPPIKLLYSIKRGRRKLCEVWQIRNNFPKFSHWKFTLSEIFHKFDSDTGYYNHIHNFAPHVFTKSHAKDCLVKGFSCVLYRRRKREFVAIQLRLFLPPMFVHASTRQNFSGQIPIFINSAEFFPPTFYAKW